MEAWTVRKQRLAQRRPPCDYVKVVAGAVAVGDRLWEVLGSDTCSGKANRTSTQIQVGTGGDSVGKGGVIF